MKTEKELNADILNITLTIRKDFPELSKYITEMPVTLPDDAHPDITVKALKDYYDSLDAMLKKYAAEHSSSTG